MVEQSKRIVRDEDAVRGDLAAIGLTTDIVREVAERATGARLEATPLDPAGTGGLRAYQMGTRATRERLLPLGWLKCSTGNVESTVNHDLGIQIIFQNVDQACRDRAPEAISEKGAASRKLINAGQGELFGHRSAGPALGRTPTVWLICVSSDEHSMCAEVSCPESFEGVQYEGFQKRLWVVDDTFENRPLRAVADVEPDDVDVFDVPVTKK